jgi:hypothetical protein
MRALRFLGSLFLLAAVIAFTADVSRPLRPDTPAFASLLKHWTDLAPQSLAAAEEAVAARVHPLVWTLAIRPVLSLPAWIVLSTVALLLLYLGRPRRRVDIFIN